MIKCGVCGSENEAQALFCGTCGSPLTPAPEPAPVEESKPVVTEPAPTDDTVVPGKGGARRDLGIGTDTGTTVTPPPGGIETKPVVAEAEPEPTGPTIVCAVCGTANDAARTYCRKCANELKAAAPTPPPPPPAARRGGISPTIIGLGAAGVVVAVGLVVILALGGLGPTATPTPAPPTSAPATNAATAPGATTAPTEGPGPTEATAVTLAELAGHIAFARCTGDDCVIVLISAATPTDVEELTKPGEGSATDPALTHDGQRVAYSVPGGLRILDIGSGDWAQHSTGRGDVSVSWSSDDARITFAGHRDRDPEPPVGDREIRLDGVSVGGPSEPLTSNKADDHDPVFSSDDESIVWVQGEGNNRELKIIDLGSRAIANLTDDAFPDVDPAADPTQRRIAFVSRRGSSDGFDLFLMTLDDKKITGLPSLPGDQHDPAWSPDGRYLVFSAPGAGGGRDLFVMDALDPARPVLLLTSTSEDDLFPTWGP